MVGISSHRLRRRITIFIPSSHNYGPGISLTSRYFPIRQWFRFLNSTPTPIISCRSSVASDEIDFAHVVKGPGCKTAGPGTALRRQPVLASGCHGYSFACNDGNVSYLSSVSFLCHATCPRRRPRLRLILCHRSRLERGGLSSPLIYTECHKSCFDSAQIDSDRSDVQDYACSESGVVVLEVMSVSRWRAIVLYRNWFDAALLWPVDAGGGDSQYTDLHDLVRPYRCPRKLYQWLNEIRCAANKAMQCLCFQPLDFLLSYTAIRRLPFSVSFRDTLYHSSSIACVSNSRWFSLQIT